MSRNGNGALTPDKFLTVEQVVRLRACLQKRAQSDHYPDVMLEFVVELMLQSGLRAGCEVVRLNIEDTPVAHNLPMLVVRHGKGDKARNVHISDELLQRIERWIKTHRKAAGPRDPLILGENGRRLKYQVLYRKLIRLGQELSIHLHTHRLRHTAGTEMLRQTNNLRFVAAQFGHEDIRTTMRYAQALISPALHEQLNQMYQHSDS